jgi:hypothetical protein
MSGKESKNEVRIRRNKEALLKFLSESGNISYACKKVGIVRDTYYRWELEDEDFFVKAREAIRFGDEGVNDLAHLQLIRNIQESKMDAIKFQLSRRHPGYKPFRPDIRPGLFDLIPELEASRLEMMRAMREEERKSESRD